MRDRDKEAEQDYWDNRPKEKKAKFSLITFQITNGDCEHYEYSYYELKNRAEVSDKDIVQDFIGSEVEVDKNDEHLFWFNDCRTIEIYGIDPMTSAELEVFKKFGVL